MSLPGKNFHRKINLDILWKGWTSLFLGNIWILLFGSERIFAHGCDSFSVWELTDCQRYFQKYCTDYSLLRLLLLSHKKEWDNAFCGNKDAIRDYLIKWSQKEKGKYLMISLYVESKIWHKRIYLQNRNRLTDTENRLMVACVEGSERFRLSVVSYYVKWLNNKVLLV